MEKESLNLRVTPELKAVVASYARTKGISANAAAALLIQAGVRHEWETALDAYRRGSQQAIALLKALGYDKEQA